MPIDFPKAPIIEAYLACKAAEKTIQAKQSAQAAALGLTEEEIGAL